MRSLIETEARRLGVDQGVCSEATQERLGSLGEFLDRVEIGLRAALREPLRLYVELVSCV